MPVVTSWMLVHRALRGDAEARVSAVIGGTWWQQRIEVVRGGGEQGATCVFTVVADPARYRTPSGELVQITFDQDGEIVGSSRDWDLIAGR